MSERDLLSDTASIIQIFSFFIVVIGWFFYRKRTELIWNFLKRKLLRKPDKNVDVSGNIFVDVTVSGTIESTPPGIKYKISRFFASTWGQRIQEILGGVLVGFIVSLIVRFLIPLVFKLVFK